MQVKNKVWHNIARIIWAVAALWHDKDVEVKNLMASPKWNASQASSGLVTFSCMANTIKWFIGSVLQEVSALQIFENRQTRL